MIRSILLSTILSLSSALAYAESSILYQEGFVPTNARFKTGDNKALAVSPIEWEVITRSGVNVALTPKDPARITYDKDAPDGDSYRIFIGNATIEDILMLVEAPAISDSQQIQDISIGFYHRDTDGNGSSHIHVTAEIGDKWYVSKPISTAHGIDWVESSVSLGEKGWSLWEGPNEDGFSADSITKPAGAIPNDALKRVGLLLINRENGDNFRIDDFTIKQR